MSTLPKRPHSREPDLSRRVRPRIQKRSESPEEGEVDEQEAESHHDKPTPVPVEREPVHEDEPKAQIKPKVAFPFKSKAKDIRKLPKVDLVNGAPSEPVKRRSLSPRPVQGDSYRPNESEERRPPPPPPRGDSYVPARDRAGSPRESYERGRPRSRSPHQHPVWDAWINPKYVSEREIAANGRPWDSYSPPRSPTTRLADINGRDTYIPPGRQYDSGPSDTRLLNHRRSPSPKSRGEYYRPHPHTYYDGPPDRGMYSRRSPSPRDHGLSPRPLSPDRFYPHMRYDDEPRNDGFRGRRYSPDARTPPPREGPMRDHYHPRPMSPAGPPPTSSAAPPPLPATDTRAWDSSNEYYPPSHQHGLPPRPMHSLPPRPNVAPPYGNGMPPPPNESSRPPAIYNRPPSDQDPVAPSDHHELNRPEASSSKQPIKSSSHKVARVRSKEEEKVAYGREFVGSGRLSEYIIMRKLGEGTFGEVHHARLRHQSKGTIRDLALKRIIIHQEKDGMPITALREIKILKALDHPNIVKVLDIVVMPRTPKDAGSVYMVFPYMDHDLAGLLENPSVKLNQSHVKLYMKQLLEGLEYMHENHIIHRDIKAANILISNEGVLQIADFGLARAYIKKSKKERMDKGLDKYTNCVVTRWYRPPELLLGERYYGAEIDLWGVGCILAEMFVRRPIFQGTSDMDQLDKIWWLCGTPTKETWPDFENLPGLDGVKEFKPRTKSLRDFLQRFDSITKDAAELIDSLLSTDPAKRPTASNALLHEYFWTSPMPADPKSMPKFESSHELDRRRKDNPPAPPPNPHQHPYHGNQGPPFQNGYHNRGMGRGGLNQPGYPPGPPGQPYMPGPPRHFPPLGQMQGPVMVGIPPGFPPSAAPMTYPPPQPYGQAPPGHPPSGLPQPRGFRPPPRQQYPPSQQQYPPQPPPHGQPYGQSYPPRPGPPNRGPNAMPPAPMSRGPPPPPDDGMILHYG